LREEIASRSTRGGLEPFIPHLRQPIAPGNSVAKSETQHHETGMSVGSFEPYFLAVVFGGGAILAIASAIESASRRNRRISEAQSATEPDKPLLDSVTMDQTRINSVEPNLSIVDNDRAETAKPPSDPIQPPADGVKRRQGNSGSKLGLKPGNTDADFAARQQRRRKRRQERRKDGAPKTAT
jgi:hypothetical protein